MWAFLVQTREKKQLSQLTPPELLNSAGLQSHPVELSRAVLSGTRNLHCRSHCQLNCAVLKTVARRGQIYYPDLHFCQNSRHVHKFYPGLVQICICNYFIQIQAISLGKSMATRLTTLRRLSNSLTNNVLDLFFTVSNNLVEKLCLESGRGR